MRLFRKPVVPTNKNLESGEAVTQSPSDLEAQIVARIGSLHSPTTAEIRSVRREFSLRLKKEPGSSIIAIALRLLGTPQFVFRFIAYELVQHHQQARQSLNARILEQLGAGLDSWAAVDTFACYLSGPAWRENQVTSKLIQRWARSKNHWWRRAAVVSTVPLNNKARGGSGDARRTLQVCEMLINDRADMVVKAMSWSLRELVKHDPAAVDGFLSKHESELATRVLREVRNKLRTGLKNPPK
jgi:3-methyladenine DNA glycosylase AlkD